MSSRGVNACVSTYPTAVIARGGSFIIAPPRDCVTRKGKRLRPEFSSSWRSNGLGVPTAWATAPAMRF